VPTVLTDREHQIMRLVSEGLSNMEIGRRLNISDGTIKVHLHHIYQKLEIRELPRALLNFMKRSLP
jgi:ATP/maltotriose-dependent transcriptional regulator MalT